jgi:hypothetical protein
MSLATTGAQISSVKTVFIIVMSEQPWSAIKGSDDAPFINSLLPTAAYADNYFSPVSANLALPNHLWLEAGTNFGVVSDAPPSTNHQVNSNHFVNLLMNAGLSWKAYFEGIDGRGCPLMASGQYRVVTNPFVYFDDVAAMQALCGEHVRPYVEFATDIRSGTIARYNFIKPGICNSMSHSCPGASNPIKQGDNWLAQEVPQILASAAYQSGGALFITWDHAGALLTDKPIGMIVLSPFAKKGQASSTRYTHGSTLRTMQQILGVTTFLGDASVQAGLDDLFAVPDGRTGAILLTWAAAPGATSYTIKRSLSERGPFTTIASGVLSTRYTDRDLTAGVTYFYEIIAVNDSGESAPSALVSAKPVSAPPAPTSVTAQPVR